MISSSREKGFQTKQEGEVNERFFKGPSSSSSRQWSEFRNPRIVRVSRSFGGKDRHSKVCTIRGLRDRRIRLSVPTAIQLYDLQDRLGLSQPSKVIDWLLDVTKHDIDKLPPLPIPQGFGHQFQPQALLFNNQSNASRSSLAPFFDINGGLIHPLLSSKEGIKINNSVDDPAAILMGSKSKYNWDVDSTSSLRAKGKEVERENNIFEEGKWINTNHEQKDDHQNGSSSTDFSGQAAASAQKLFPPNNHPSLPGLLNTAIPFNSSYHWEPSNLSLSQFGSHEFLSQAENSLYSNAVSLPSSLAFPSVSHLFFCPPATMPSSFFSAYSPYVSTAAESESRQINQFQLLSSTSQHVLPNSLTINSQVKPFSLNVNNGLAQTQTNAESHQDKEVT